MKSKNYSSRPVAASLLAGLLCCLPTSNQHAQIVIGTTTAAGFSGQATAVSGVARAASACATLFATASGVVQISGLVINGQAVAVTGAANQFVFLADGGYVIINEQVAGFSGATVNALHIVDAFAGVNVVIASATA